MESQEIIDLYAVVVVVIIFANSINNIFHT